MKIGELAARASLNASAIRYYEKLGLLAPPQRTGGQRRYPSDALHRVLLIRFATDMGFTLAEIKLFLSGLRDTTPVGPTFEYPTVVVFAGVTDCTKYPRDPIGIGGC